MTKNSLPLPTDNDCDYEQVVEALLKHPEGLRSRSIAQNIVSLLFHAGRTLFLEEVTEDDRETAKCGLKKCTVNTPDRCCMKPTDVLELMNSFRDEIRELLGAELPLNDDDLYKEIVYPLNMKQISNALKPKR